MKKVLAICGSTRTNSINLRLIQIIAELYQNEFQTEIFDAIGELPHFSPDFKEGNTPDSVLNFRNLIQLADGVLICSPEYAHGVPGSLKNAIDWCVTSNEFSDKPTALITASTEGHFAHAALLETLKVIQAKKVEELQLMIPYVKTKMRDEGIITDEQTLKDVKNLIFNFIKNF